MADFNWEHIIIRDTEFTSWEWAQERNRSWPNEFRELVQIWAIKINTATRQEIDTFSIFIKPTKNPILSEYFIQLTEITQEEVDTKGEEFIPALAKFVKRAGDRDSIDLYSYGGDEAELAENCELHHIAMPFCTTRFKDVRTVFLANKIPADKYISSSINQYFDIPNDETEHNALSDARNIFHSLQALYTGTQ